MAYSLFMGHTKTKQNIPNRSKAAGIAIEVGCVCVCEKKVRNNARPMNNALNESDGLGNFDIKCYVCFYRPKTSFICDDLTTNSNLRTQTCSVHSKIGFAIAIWHRIKIR